MKKFIIILLVLLVPSAARAAFLRVQGVIDGDTLILDNGLRVELIGLDAPEITYGSKARRDSETTGRDLVTMKAMGIKAAEFVRSLTVGRTVRLEYDVQKEDPFTRDLAYVYLTEEPTPRAHTFSPYPEGVYYTEHDGKKEVFLNATIITMGYAASMTLPPNIKYSELFLHLYQDAKKKGRGLWGNKAGITVSPQ